MIDRVVYIVKWFQLQVILMGDNFNWLKQLFTVVDFIMITILQSRPKFFSYCKRVCGNPFPSGFGLCYGDYQSVADTLNANDQKRGPFIGTSPVLIPEFFDQDMMIFHDKDKHEQLRNSFMEWMKKYHMVENKVNISHIETFKNSEKLQDDYTRLVTHAVFSKFNIKVSIELEAAFVTYRNNALFLFLPKFFHFLSGKHKRNIMKQRKIIHNILREVIHDGSIIDTIAFAAILGTAHLFQKCWENIHLFSVHFSISSFVQHVAMIDPPVTSITVLNQNEKKKVQIMGNMYQIPLYQRECYVISEAHKDPRSRNKDNLCWNGKGIRKCPGKDISLAICEELLESII